MVTEFMKHCNSHLLDQFSLSLARTFQGASKDGNAIRSHDRVPGITFSPRYALVQTEYLVDVCLLAQVIEVARTWFVFDHDRDIVEHALNVDWQGRN
jgi:hypothetical protein